MDAPERRSLGQKTADALEKAIRSHQWQKHLPGYRKLGELMGVSPRTMHEALSLLTRRGVILPAESTKPRTINPKIFSEKQPPERKNLLIIANSSLQEQEVLARSIIEKISTLFIKKGWTITYEANPEIYQSPGSHFESLATQYPNHRWLLIKASMPVINWCWKRRLQFICIGGEAGKRKPPLISANLSDMFHRSVSELHALGHRRISTLRPHTGKEARQRIIQHLSATMEEFGMSFHPSYHFPLMRSHTSGSLRRALDRLFSHSPPTALIATDVQQLIGIYSYALEHGIRIPEDLSVVLTQQSRHISWFHPRPAHFTLSASDYVNRAKRWVEHYPISEMEPVFLTPEFHKGHSIAPAPSL